MAVEPAKATTINGESFTASLASVDADWNVSLSSGDQRQTLSAAELLRWGRPADPRGGIGKPHDGAMLLLADGGRLIADVWETDGDNLRAGSLLLDEEFDLPLERIAGILFRPPGDDLRRDRLMHRVRDLKADGDLVILENGDELHGRFLALKAEYDGVEVSKVQVAFDPGAGPVDIEVRRVAALAFNPRLLRAPSAGGLRAFVGLSDGGRLLARRMTLPSEEGEAGGAQIEDFYGVQWQAPADDIVWLRPLGGDAVYFSDLAPTDYRHIPYLTVAWPLARDRNVLGGELRSGEAAYLKGLCTVATSRTTYDLDRSYSSFHAEIALDDAAENLGSATFRVFVDGRQAYKSPTVRGGDAPVPFSVDLRGARRISLVVDFAERGDVRDYANWLGARLVP